MLGLVECETKLEKIGGFNKNYVGILAVVFFIKQVSRNMVLLNFILLAELEYLEGS